MNYISFPICASLIGLFLISSRDYQKIITWQLSPVTVALPSIFIRFFQRSKAPIFHYVHDLWPESLEASGLVHNKIILQAVGLIVKFVYRFSDKILVQSKGMVASVERYGVQKNKIVYMPNWSEDYYKPIAYNKELAKEEDLLGFFIVMFAGNLGVSQNLEILLKVAKELLVYTNIRIVLYGDGPSKLALEKQAENLPNVVFKGRRKATEMPELLALADVTLVSLKRTPIFAITAPSKIQSYLACGRPIIAALEGSGATIVQEAKAGLVCEPDSPQFLKTAILQIYQMNSDEREQMGKNGRLYYEKNFDRSKVLDHFFELFSE